MVNSLGFLGGFATIVTKCFHNNNNNNRKAFFLRIIKVGENWPLSVKETKQP